VSLGCGRESNSWSLFSLYIYGSLGCSTQYIQSIYKLPPAYCIPGLAIVTMIMNDAGEKKYGVDRYIVRWGIYCCMRHEYI